MENPKSSLSPLQSFLRTFQKIKEKISGVEQNLEKQWEHRGETVGRVRRRALVVKEKLVEKAELAGQKLGSMLGESAPIPREKSTAKRINNSTNKRRSVSKRVLPTKNSPLTQKLSRTKAKV